MHLEYISEIAAPVEKLRDFHFRPGAFHQLIPPWEKAVIVESPAELIDGARAVIETKIGPFTKRWIAVHELTGDGFVDRQQSGPFAAWTHYHRFEPIDEIRCRLTDAIDCELPFGWLGRLCGGRFVKKKLDAMFRYRHEITRRELEG